MTRYYNEKYPLEVYVDDDDSPPTVRIILPSAVNLPAETAIEFANAILAAVREIEAE